MKNALRKLRNYICYCGIEKDEFKAVKKDARASNFHIWKILHVVMDVSFAVLFIISLFNEIAKDNKYFYLGALIYSLVATAFFFFVLKKDSPVGQLVIYLSISVLFLFACFITQNKPNSPAITFIAFLLIIPLFMVDRPYLMALELVVTSTVFLIWMYFVKDPEVWKTDFMNTILFTIVGIFIHVIFNAIRIKEFVLIRKINIQKDIDELTGLKNKAALTRKINEFFKNNPKGSGLLFVLDIDYFKTINDTYGHDVGDVVLREFGEYLRKKFIDKEILGRFGGDEFIIFFKNIDDPVFAEKTANEIIKESAERIKLPTDEVSFATSVGAAIYKGEEKNYSELFKKADIALYKTKANRKIHYSVYQE